jgi:rhodanese-related sulfurtransferase
MEPKRITVEELKRRMDSGERLAILDNRAQEAWEKSDVQIPGSLRVPPDEAGKHLQEIPQGAAIVTYCT